MLSALLPRAASAAPRRAPGHVYIQGRCFPPSPMGAYQTIESQYVVQYKRFGCEKVTGEGAFGKVRACIHSGSNKLRAVKSIEKTSWSVRGRVLEEIEILKAVAGKHPNIIEFVEYFEEWGVLNLIFEYCPKGTLEKVIKERPAMAEADAVPLAWQICGALAFLLEASIVHRDVKPANLLFCEDEATLKLADFGTAVCSGELMSVPAGTPAFCAPEVHMLRKSKGYSFPVDTWAFGITLYMLLFKGLHPFEDKGNLVKWRYLSGDFDAGWFTSSRAKDLLEWLMLPHPGQRIRPDEALGHGWFAAHQLGEGGFAKTKPGKLVLDSHGNWLKSRI